MDKLLNIKSKIPIKTIVKKQPVKKREQAMQSDNNHNNKYSNEPKMILSDRSGLCTVYAYMLSETRAKYQNTVDSSNDYFYRCLLDLKKQHIEFLEEQPVEYHTPFDNTEFKFKNLGRMLVCKNKAGRILMPADCFNKKVVFKLRVRPYDFISKITKKRCVGLSIQVSQVIVLV